MNDVTLEGGEVQTLALELLVVLCLLNRTNLFW